MQILSNAISPLNVRKTPKFSRHLRNLGRGIRQWCHILDRKWKYGRFAHALWNMLIYDRIAEIPASLRISGSRNTTVTSDWRAEEEIWPFPPCVIHLATGTVRSLWTWLWDRYHVPQNVFLVPLNFSFIRFWGGVANLGGAACISLYA